MRFGKKQVYYLLALFILFLAVLNYWDAAASIVSTVFKAAQPFLIGAAVAYVVNIVMSLYEIGYDWLFKNVAFMKGLKRPLSMILAYTTFVVVIIWLFSIILPDLIASISSLMNIDTSIIKKLIKEINQNPHIARVINYVGSDKEIVSQITNFGQQILKQVLTALMSLMTSVTSIAQTFINVFMSVIFSFYVLGNKEKLGRQFNLLIDTFAGKYAKKMHYVIGILHKRFHGFIVGQTLEAMILGTLTAIGMMILSFPYASTIGVLVAFTALIPVIGAYIGVTIGFFLIVTQSVPQAVAFVIFMIILQQFEGNLIYPRVVGGSIGLPGMWVLVAITIGGSLYGFLGMLMAVPIAASIYQIIKDQVAKRQSVDLDNPDQKIPSEIIDE
ncbi:MAG: AI-2E family transporter [Streptococcus hyointestinalis]|uniref:Membrane protein n=1 Tax=Streptococcus hyointestinalis TaxID=1337 RepID=A0A380KB16_9STRE|nr:AI-2E family transporter [Streptococcus hyointestinalis]MCI6870948.1 AI-2E family transporter [Streptococcus hyointestinalis]MDD7356407.1 AI-2E family transporter [Streptococcus hyointestinalis]MDY4553829.1 AI-2E family transporter [Streptococcus hyointestinalis]SUN62131.1 membrane protein [Streptococcus hyointestinalis]